MEESIRKTSQRSARPPIPLRRRALILAIRFVGVIWPRLAGRWVYDLWLHPPRYHTPAHEAALLDSAATPAFTFNHRPLAVYAWGEGPTVLLVHGWSGRGTQLGALVEPLTAAGFRVVTYDGPAHGRTQGKYTNALEQSAALVAVARGFGPIHAVVSHSLGTLVALLALHEGLTTERLVCIAAPAGLNELMTRFGRRLRLPPAVVADVRGRIDRRFGSEIWQRVSSVTLASQARVAGLVIHDRDDRDVPWEEGHAISRAWPGAQFVLTEGLGHRRILRDAEVVARIVGFVRHREPVTPP